MLWLTCGIISYANDLARFSVKPVSGAGVAPVSVSLDMIDYNTDKGAVALFEISPSGEKEIPSQVETGVVARLWFIFDVNEKLAINEVWDVRLWETGIDGISMVDFTSTLNTPLVEGVLLNDYRYGGGLGYRATEKWHRDNCTVLTSEGKTREEADGTSARWCIVEGEANVHEGRSGILFLSHPSNRMHPEPMRVWPLNANRGRGDMFFEFCPIRHEEWKIDHGRNYTLKYRMIVFDGTLTTEEAEEHWRSFSYSPLIRYFK